MLMAGDQIPKMPSLEIVGKEKEPPEQMGDTCVKVGVTLGLTTTVIGAVEAHWPAVGVKV